MTSWTEPSKQFLLCAKLNYLAAATYSPVRSQIWQNILKYIIIAINYSAFTAGHSTVIKVEMFIGVFVVEVRISWVFL